jgi:FixJ family two-component response regulator
MTDTTNAAATIHVVDDDAHFRTSIVFLLDSAGFRSCSYDSAEAFLMAAPDGPGCVLLDVSMPGLSGLELQQELHARQRVMPIIFLTAQGDLRTSVRAMRAGAEDFLGKPVDIEELLDAVHRALARDVAARQAGVRAEALRRRAAALTAREREVLSLVAAGRLNKLIASDLQLALQTVKFHRANVMTKLEAGSTAELVLLAAELGITVPPGTRKL